MNAPILAPVGLPGYLFVRPCACSVTGLAVGTAFVSSQRQDDQMPADRPPMAPLMVPAEDAAALIGVSPATWHRMVAAGKTPAPVKLSAGCVRWRVADLRTWIDAGCPDRKTWLSMAEDAQLHPKR